MTVVTAGAVVAADVVVFLVVVALDEAVEAFVDVVAAFEVVVAAFVSEVEAGVVSLSDTVVTEVSVTAAPLSSLPGCEPEGSADDEASDPVFVLRERSLP